MLNGENGAESISESIQIQKILRQNGVFTSQNSPKNPHSHTPLSHCKSFLFPDSNRDTRSRGRQAVNTLPYSRCCGFRCTVNSIHPSAQVGRHLPGLSWSQFYHRTAFYAKEEYRVIANDHCWPLPKKTRKRAAKATRQRGMSSRESNPG